MAHVLGVTHEELKTAFAASKRPACYRKTTSMVNSTDAGDWKFAKPGAWHGGKNGLDKPLIYSARNTRVTAGMKELMQGLNVNFVEDMGLILDDPEETLAKARVPASPFRTVPQSASGTLELKRAYSSGNPSYYAERMMSSAVGGVIGAEAVLQGGNADLAVRNALNGARWDNFLFWIETTRMAGLSDMLIRLSPRAAMIYPHSRGIKRWEAAI